MYFADDEESLYEKMKLINVLEILITPDEKEENTEKIDFTWEITAYNRDYFWIQLDFTNP